MGLKAYAEELHQHWIPIPSVLLNGPGNMPGCKRFPFDSVSMLESTVDACLLKEEELILVLGYLADLEQLEQLTNYLSQDRLRFSKILIDPICGDNGAPYVDTEIIQNYCKLLKFAEYHTPNVTELLLISSKPTLKEAMDWWKSQFPETHLMVTGVTEEHEVGVFYQNGEQSQTYFHPSINGSFSGAGDRFVSKFLKTHFCDGHDPVVSMKISADYVKNLFEI